MISRNRVRLSAALVTFMALAAPAEAQERKSLTERTSRARIEASSARSLSFAGLDVAPDVLARAFPLPAGGWGVTSRVFDGGIRLFDVAGRPAGVLGRSGEGPGEFGGPVHGVVVGRRLWLADAGNGRLSVYSSDLELEGDRPLPGRLHDLSVSPGGGGVLVSGFLYSGTETHAVARLTLDASRDAFGGVVETPSARVSLKVACAAPHDEIWTFSNSGGAVNILAVQDLSVRQRWTLVSDELQQEAPRRPVPGEPPVPQVVGCTSDGGRIWLLVGVADSEWSADVNPARDGAAEYWDTLIIAIDAPTRSVVARKRLDELCLPVAASEVSCVDELQQVIRLRELSLTTPNAP